MLSQDTLRGERIYLSGIEEDDIVTIHRWNTDMDYLRYLAAGLPRLYPEKSLRAWLLDDNDDNQEMRPFAIRLHQDNTLIGMLAFKNFNWQARHCLFWIGIGEPTYRGKGYGSEAVHIMLRYAFQEINLQRVGLEVGAFNEPARRAYEKCGFQLEGTLRRVMYRDGQYWDMHIMGILREEWEAAQG